MKDTQEKEYKDYLYKNNNYVSLVHGSPRPLFISQDKKDEYKSLQQLSVARIITGLVACILLLIGIYIGFLVYVVPYFSSLGKQSQQAEAENSTITEENVESEVEVSYALDILGYDSVKGLPIFADSFNLFMINSSNPVGEDFEVMLGEFQGVKLDVRIVEALSLMVSDAKASGVNIRLKSGLISYDEQLALYNSKVNELITKENYTKIMARAEAKKQIPYPGEADSETGMSITLSASSAVFKESNVYTWLNNYAADYGFVFRYPEGKEQITGAQADYTVIRYVGIDNAITMRQLSMCLEEYVSYVNAK